LTDAKAQIVIRRPVREVFDAFVDPDVTTKIWFTHSTGRVEQASTCDGTGRCTTSAPRSMCSPLSTEGFALLLVGAKALLEHGIELNLVADHSPPETRS
jgi:hypothetical protein